MSPAFHALAPMALAVCFALQLPPVAHAQTPPPTGVAVYEISLPAQPLAQSLAAIARQTGTTLIAEPALLTGRSAPAISGRLTAQQAYARALAGSGLAATLDGTSALVRAAPPPSTAPDTTLPEVSVRAPSVEVPPTASIGAPPPAFGGGNVARGLSVGALGPRSLIDLPFAGQSYTDALVTDRQWTSVQDLQRFNPSVNANFPIGANFNDVAIRGFNATYLLDGVPLLIQGGGSLEPYERIEVLKGVAASALGALAGSTLLNVNLIPKRAGETPLTEVTARYYGGGAAGLAADFARRFGEGNAWGLRVNAAADAGETNIEGYKLDRQLGHLALDYRGDKLRTSLDVQAIRLAPNGSPTSVIVEDPAISIPAVPDTRRTTGQPWGSFTEERQTNVARVEYDLLPNWTLGAVGSFASYDQTQFLANPIFVLNNQGDTSVEIATFAREAESRTLQGYARGRMQTRNARHQVSFFVERYKQEGDNSVYNTDSCNDNLYVRQPCPQPALAFIAGGSSFSNERTGAVGVYELGLFEERLLLTAGVRRSKLSTTFRNLVAATGNEFEGEATTPLAGIVFKPQRWLSLFGSYAESLEFGAVAPNSAANRGESTPPVTGKQIELGVKVDTGRYGGELAWFNIVRDSAFTDPATNVFGLLGEQEHKGVELSGYGEIARGWKLLAGATWIDARYSAALDPTVVGNRVIAVPEFRFVGTLETDLGRAFGVADGVSLYGTVVHTSKVTFDIDNTKTLPAFTTLDLGVNYRFPKRRTTVRLAVLNVTDEAYWTTNYIGGDLNISAPRTFVGSLTVGF